MSAEPGVELVAFVWVRPDGLDPNEYPGLLLHTRQLDGGGWEAYVIYRRYSRAIQGWFSPGQVRPHGRG